MKKNDKIIICDIDDTVAVLGKRRAELLRQPSVDWDAFYADDFDDEPIADACRTVRRLLDAGRRVVFSTSRRESARRKTLGWLHLHISAGISNDMLLMRPNDCPDNEAVQKVKGVLSRHAADDIEIVIDDNISVLCAWKARGVPVLDARKGLAPLRNH